MVNHFWVKIQLQHFGSYILISSEIPKLELYTRLLTQDKYSECFEGLGKKKNDFQLKIAIDENVKSVQLLRRIPYHLRDKVEQML